MSRTCTTHHIACDCREEKLKELLEDVMTGHKDPNDSIYNGCDKALCAWCEDTHILIYGGRPDQQPTKQ